MDINQIKKILEPQFGYLAKSTGEQLWFHNFAVWNVCKKISDLIPSLDQNEKIILELACLLHDIGKETDKNQEVLTGNKIGKVPHKFNMDYLKKYLEKIQSDLPHKLSENDIKQILDIIRIHHSISNSDLENMTTDSCGIFTEILRYSDWLASMDIISPSTINKIKNALANNLDISYFQISRLRSPSYYTISKVLIKHYQNNGWIWLLNYDNGAVFLGPKNTKLPNKSELIDEIYNELLTVSLKNQKPNASNFTKAMLAGESANNPELFLEVHKDTILENENSILSDITKCHLFFFKFVIELLKENNFLTKENLKNLPVLEILNSASGTRGVPKARSKWKEIYKKDTPENFSELLKQIFDNIMLNEVIPEGLIDLSLNRKLKDISTSELFDILKNLSIVCKKDQKLSKPIKQYISNIISLEEEVNFKEIAEEIFINYKEYKTTSNASKGVCEMCACPHSMEAKGSLGFPSGVGYGFTQIKTKPLDRATCLLCALDTMTLRQNVSKDKSDIFVRFENKIPDVNILYPELNKLIQKIIQGTAYPSNIVKLSDDERFNNIPFSKRISIPIPAKERDMNLDNLLIYPLGTYFPISKAESYRYSVKDMRAKYAPLYHLLNLLGFKVNIGSEEQQNLFGEKLISNEATYFKALSVILISNIIEKKDNKYIFAENLLNKSPSVVLTYLASAIEDNKINKVKAEKIIEFIYKSDLEISKIEGKKVTMKEILKDAAFFAEGIPNFCWTADDWKKWNQSNTKHLITKPVSKTMNEIIQGRDYEEAFAKFLSYIRENIAKEKAPDKEGGAKTDINELKIFVDESQKIIKRYYDLKKVNISDFIKAKNALLSAIFVCKRYSNLKEIITND